jgi:hypothetical protein
LSNGKEFKEFKEFKERSQEPESRIQEALRWASVDGRAKISARCRCAIDIPLDHAGFEPRRVVVSCRAALKIMLDQKLSRSAIGSMTRVLY